MAVTSGGTDVAILDNAAHARPVVDRLCLALVILVAVVTAVFVYVAFWRDADRLWAGLDHDRNYHYGVALALADDVRHFNVPSLFDDLRHIRTWPPLHALLVGAVVTFAGPDFRVAVLPNLVAWTTTCVVIFLLTRATVRTFDRSSVFAANLAGFVAAGFALGSPGHRAFATDLMLESLGACLSMTCLYLYVRFRCFDGGVRALAVALVLLFFLKYNYWLLVAGALSGHTLWLLRQRALAVVAAGLTALRNGGWWLTQAKNPLTWLVSALLLLSAVVVICGGLSVAFAGREIVFSARSDNLLHVTLIVAVLRVAMAWPTEGRQIWQRLAPTTRKMALWHGLPVLLWFLLPKRLGYFIWFLSPRNGVNSDGNVVAAAQYYASEFAGTYHAVPLAAAVVLVAATLGCCTLFRRRAALAIVVFVLFSCLLTMNHPNRKSRFLHSWVPAVWVLAGVGTAALMTGPEPSPRRAWKTAAAATLGITALATTAPGLWARPHSPEGGVSPGSPSTLAVSHAYLPWLTGSGRTAVLSNVDAASFATWSHLAAFPASERPYVDQHWLVPDDAASGQQVSARLAASEIDRVVLIEAVPQCRFHPAAHHPYDCLRQELERSDRFVLTESAQLDEVGFRTTLWLRRERMAANETDNPRH